MNSILVSGGAGFIGSHLCRRLLEEGNKVYCLDNLYTGKIENIKKLTDFSQFIFLEQDVQDEIDVEINQIYNLACPASPVHYQYNPISTTKTSVLGTLNMLELARKYKGTILQASTSEVYGEPLVHPQVESYWGNVNPIGLRSCYDEGKRCAETLMADYYRYYGVNTKIVRIFNTYGPNMDIRDGRVVSNFITQALKNKNITVYGDGSQTRSFCYVDDLVDGLIKMMNTPNFNGPVNLGNPNERTVLNLAEKIIELSGSSSKIIYQSLPADDPTRRKPDIELAKAKLGWEPKVSFEEGLVKTIEYFSRIM